MLESNRLLEATAVSSHPALGPNARVNVGAAYEIVVVEVMHFVDVLVIYRVGLTDSVMVVLEISKMVVVGAVPAMSVVVVLTAGAVMITVSVDVTAGKPIHEQAVASMPSARVSKAEIACAASQVELASAAATFGVAAASLGT